MESYRILRLSGLLLLQVAIGLCGLRCEQDQWKWETLRCVPVGSLKNNIKPRETTTNDLEKYEDLIPLERFHKYDWRSIKTFVMKNANLKTIHPDLFANASSLELLDLSGNADLRIRGAFVYLNNLRSLDLSESSLSSRSDVNEVLKLSQLQYLNISNMKRSKLLEPHVILNELNKLPNLETLDVSRNNITDLRNYDFSGKLKSINLSHNRLTIGERNFENATNLRYLGLSSSSLSIIPGNAFAGTTITHLDLSINSLTLESLPCLQPSMTHINLSRNSLINDLPLTLKTFSNSVEVYDVSYNELRELDRLTDNDTRNVRWLNAARNRLYNLHGFFGFIELVTLDISFNLLLTLPSLAFAGAAKLETLNLAGNRIYQISENTFRANTALVSLSLRSNFLGTLNLRTFKGLRRLYQLDLSNNNLRSVPRDLLYEEGLRELNLSCNLLSYLDDDFVLEFPGNGKLIIYGNPWKCACLFKVLGKITLDPQYLVDGNHPSCYVGEVSDDTCRNTTLNESDVDKWTDARKFSALPCNK